MPTNPIQYPGIGYPADSSTDLLRKAVNNLALIAEGTGASADGLTDISLRILTTTIDNTNAVGGFDIKLIRN